MKTVLTHWVAWGTGSSLVFVLWILDSVYQLKIPKWMLVSFLVVGFFVSSFQAWCDQYSENELGRSAGSFPLEGLQLVIFRHEGKRQGDFQVQLVLKNLQNRLIEYQVDNFELEIGGKKGGDSFSNRGGYVYANSTSIFLAPFVPVDDTTQLAFSGKLQYMLSYHAFGSEIDHHTSKVLNLNIYTQPGNVQHLTVEEHED